MTARFPKLLLTGIAAVMPCAVLGPVLGEDAPPLARLRIATWNFADAVATGALKLEVPKKPVWRTTFGAERYTAKKPQLDPTTVEPDVLLLQGVTSVRDARQFFPARRWRLVMSRELLARDESEEAPAALNAIAVRLQRGLRFAGQEHFEAPPDAPAGLALRLASQGRIVWVASSAFGPDCTLAAAECAQAAHLEKWRQEKLAAGANAVVVGGRIAMLPQAKRRETTPPEAKPAASPAALVAPPQQQQQPLVAQDDAKAEAAPKTTLLGWLLGWSAAPETKHSQSAPQPVKSATPAAAPDAKEPSRPIPAPPPATKPESKSLSPQAVALPVAKDGDLHRLTRRTTDAPCGTIGLVAMLDASGHAHGPEQGFYLEKLGCLAYFDLAIEPAPPPPPVSWPEAVEPASGTADPDEAADDAG